MVKALIYACFETKNDDYSSCAPLAFTKDELLAMIEIGEINRNLYLTPQDIMWLRRWLPKYRNSKNKYKIDIYEYPPEERKEK